MPSQLHEVLLELFRNRPALAPELLQQALHVELPAYTEARLESADLSELRPTEYRADLVVLLLDDQPVLGIVVEVQLRADADKAYAWPVYVTSLRARIRCPVYLLVITHSDSVARACAKPIVWAAATRSVHGFWGRLVCRRSWTKITRRPIRSWPCSP